LAIDSSFAGDGDGSERRSPREMFASDDLDGGPVLWLSPVEVMEMVGSEKADGVAVEKERVDDEESEDRRTFPATGMRTMQRRRLSKP
jgi:hypothetical protein